MIHRDNRAVSNLLRRPDYAKRAVGTPEETVETARHEMHDANRRRFFIALCKSQSRKGEREPSGKVILSRGETRFLLYS